MFLLQEQLPFFLTFFWSSHRTLGVRPPLRTFYIKIDSQVPLTYPNFLWSTSLHFGVTRFFSANLVLFCPCPWNQPFSKDSLFLLSREWDLLTKIWALGVFIVIKVSSRSFQEKEQGKKGIAYESYTCVYVCVIHMCVIHIIHYLYDIYKSPTFLEHTLHMCVYEMCLYKITS